MLFLTPLGILGTCFADAIHESYVHRSTADEKQQTKIFRKPLEGKEKEMDCAGHQVLHVLVLSKNRTMPIRRLFACFNEMKKRTQP